jgi:hypothetical protein
MSKLQALLNYLEIDSIDDIMMPYGNQYNYKNDEYEIMTEEEVIEYGADLIADDLEEILFQSVPKHLHKYFNKEEYVNDRIDDAFDYVDFGYGCKEIEDNDGNKYFLFPI